MKILIADDHAIVRKGLKETLLEHDADWRIDEVTNGADLIHRIETSPYDLLLLDISMPGLNGLEALKRVKSLHPDLPVLMLSMHPEEQYARRAFNAGASGYLHKSTASDELIQAVNKARRGEKYITPQAAQVLTSGQDGQPAHERLSDREFEILKLIAAGKGPKEIASRLHISVKTADNLRARIIEKMGATTTADLIRYSIKNNLIE